MGYIKLGRYSHGFGEKRLRFWEEVVSCFLDGNIPANWTGYNVASRGCFVNL